MTSRPSARPAALPVRRDGDAPVVGPLCGRLAGDGARVAVVEVIVCEPWEPDLVGRAWPAAEWGHLTGRPLWAAREAGFRPVHPRAATALRRRLDAWEVSCGTLGR